MKEALKKMCNDYQSFKVSEKLSCELRDIQDGVDEDVHNNMHVVCADNLTREYPLKDPSGKSNG